MLDHRRSAGEQGADALQHGVLPDIRRIGDGSLGNKKRMSMFVNGFGEEKKTWR
jgi:hypothetical protein